MILVTGAAGFIGFHVAATLLARGHRVAGVDHLDGAYDPRLKVARLALLEGSEKWSFHKLDLSDRQPTESLFEELRPRVVVHMAAQAGSRQSLAHSHAYVGANLVGFHHVLEGCRAVRAEHLVYASSSAVYGLNRALPLGEHKGADHPVSFYGATKRANELMAHSYAHIFGLPCTGVRLFTVYGPWARPDMAMSLFTQQILDEEPIQLFNAGRMRRDFVYIDDAVEALVGLIERPPTPNRDFDAHFPDPAISSAPFRILNVGHRQPVELERLVGLLEDALDRRAIREPCPAPATELLETQADTGDVEALLGWRPTTPLEVGVRRFVEWYRSWTGL